jgi:ribosome-associated protein
MSLIPKNELKFTTARSGGKGGQHVNKTETKVQISWNIAESTAFGDTEKRRIQSKLKNRISDAGFLQVECESSRSQLANKEEAIVLLEKLVANALAVPKKRIPTKPGKAARQRRLDKKKKQSDKKASRRFNY